MVERVLRGMDPLAGSADVVAEIAEGLQLGSFLGTRATVKGYRQSSHFPKLFERYNVGHWRAKGTPTILAEAWRRAQEQIEACDFHLPAEQQKALDSIYRKALKTVT